MAQVSICCANPQGYVLDRCVVELADINEARAYAKILAQSLDATAGQNDWKSCRFHVRNEKDEEVFIMPFAFALERRNRRARASGSVWDKFMAFQF